MGETQSQIFHLNPITNQNHQTWEDQLCRPGRKRDDKEDKERGENFGGGEQHQQESDGNNHEILI